MAASVTARTYTADEARVIAETAARETVSRLLDLTPERPLPTYITVGEATRMLEVSPRTLARMKVRRSGRRVLYADVVRQMLAR